ncbi:NEDD4-binding protein [Elysia marginata]|uniref:NEDD4-binding protein n=1 Tax=Elysia marginata TaxID=1093978 RepID=A0AAV4GWT5_9GAST|nr:NEDD4-binding protein [Elysia marginata]
MCFCIRKCRRSLHDAEAALVPEIPEGLRDTAQISSDDTTIDLHGLYRPKALAEVRDFLDRKERKYRIQTRYVFIITGRGNHSKDGKPVLKPAVEEFLTNNDYNFEFANPGMIKVDLCRRI